MAATIAEADETFVIRWTEEDVFGEQRTKTIEVDGAATDSQIEAFLDDYEAETNVKVSKCTVTGKRAVTGLAGSATNALQNVITAWLGLTFRAPNTVNPSRPVDRVMKLRAPVSTSYDLTGNPITGIVPNVAAAGTTDVARLNRITGFLESFLVYRPTETDPIVSGTFVWTGGQLATDSGIIDGDSLT